MLHNLIFISIIHHLKSQQLSMNKAKWHEKKQIT